MPCFEIYIVCFNKLSEQDKMMCKTPIQDILHCWCAGQVGIKLGSLFSKSQINFKILFKSDITKKFHRINNENHTL